MDAVQFLIDNGADVNITDNDGVGIWDYTSDNRFLLLIAFILRLQEWPCNYYICAVLISLLH